MPRKTETTGTRAAVKGDTQAAGGFMGLGGYLSETQRPVYTFMLVVPFVLFYEAGLVALGLSAREFSVRNGADAILRALFFPAQFKDVGTAGTVIWVFFSALILLGAFVCWQLRSADSWRLRRSYLRYSFLEGFGWAVMLFILWIVLLAFGLPEGLSTSCFVSCSHGGGQAEFSLSARLVMSAGAGVYEELLFRLLFTGGIVLVLRGLFGVRRLSAVIGAVLFSSLIFAIIHYLGPYGDPSPGSRTEWLGFFFRVGAGVFFSLLFYYRSFGMAVAAHAFYDIIVNLVVTALSPA